MGNREQGLPDITLQEEIEGLWAILTQKEGEYYRTARLTRSVLDRRIGVTVDPSGAQHILIPHPPAEDQRGLWRSLAITLHRVNLKEGEGIPETWLDLHCKRPELGAVFLRLAASVIEQIGPSPEDVLASCISSLNEWRDLLGQGRGQVSEESIIGLMGEMLLLERLARIDAVKALEAWDGPRGGRHDFRRGLIAVEVKTTTRRSGRFLKIHGLTQLEEPDNGSLHLVFIRLEKVSGGSKTIATMAGLLTGIGIPRDELLEILKDYGIDTLDMVEARVGYEVIEWLVYRVTDGFPRIIETSFKDRKVPDGVLTVDYTIDLTATPPDPLLEDAAEAVLYQLIKVR